MRIQLSWLITVLILAFTHGLHGQSVYIPSFDPVYEDISALVNRGYLADLHVTQRPWIAGDVVRSIVNDYG
jgi:hypothetical protein